MKTVSVAKDKGFPHSGAGIRLARVLLREARNSSDENIFKSAVPKSASSNSKRSSMAGLCGILTRAVFSYVFVPLRGQTVGRQLEI